MYIFILGFISTILLIIYFEFDFIMNKHQNKVSEEYIQSVKNSVTNGKPLEEEIELYKKEYTNSY